MSSGGQKAYLTIMGPEEVIRSLSAMEQTEGFRVGKAQPVDGLADAVDSVLGPDEIKQLLEFATVVLEFGSATIAFVSALKAQLAGTGASGKRQIHVLDGRTNVEIVTIDEGTDETAAREAIEFSTTK